MKNADPRRKDVILAEDDNDDVLVFELAAKESEIAMDIRHADNGDKLFVLLKQDVPDVLFLDIHMPCKDGVACIVEIRKHHEYDNLPVIMYTSHTTEKHVNDCFRNGANLYMIKTRTIKELANNLRSIFSIDWKNHMYYPPKHQFVLS